MAVLDANALTADASGLAFLADVLGTSQEAEAPGRRFPIEAWTPSLPPVGLLDATLCTGAVSEPRHVELA